MRKQLFSLLMILALAVGMCVPVSASLMDEEVTGVRLSSTYITMTTGTSRTLTATVTPSGAFTTFSWSSSNSDVASVSSDGTVYAVRSGEANITVRTENGRTTMCHVVVKNENDKDYADRITLSLDTMTVRVDQTRLLYPIYSPVRANEDVSWTTSNSNVATVDARGNVYGVGPGTCTITATTYSGGASASCTVTVPGNVVSSLTSDADTSTTKDSGDMLTSSVARSTVTAAAKETKRNEVGYATFKNMAGVAPEVVKAAAYAATQESRDIRLRFVTTDDRGRTLGSVIFDPQAATERTTNLYTQVQIASSKITTTKTRFNTGFANKSTALQLSHSGSFGLTVQVAAKVDLTGYDTGDLHLYAYDTATNRYDPLTGANVWVDKNGFLQFSTTTGGVIVVSEGPLRK